MAKATAKITKIEKASRSFGRLWEFIDCRVSQVGDYVYNQNCDTIFLVTFQQKPVWFSDDIWSKAPIVRIKNQNKTRKIRYVAGLRH